MAVENNRYLPWKEHLSSDFIRYLYHRQEIKRKLSFPDLQDLLKVINNGFYSFSISHRFVLELFRFVWYVNNEINYDVKLQTNNDDFPITYNDLYELQISQINKNFHLILVIVTLNSHAVPPANLSTKPTYRYAPLHSQCFAKKFPTVMDHRQFVHDPSSLMKALTVLKGSSRSQNVSSDSRSQNVSGGGIPRTHLDVSRAFVASFVPSFSGRGRYFEVGGGG